MREIDNRYPEFAEPNAPVKRGKRHKGLNWSFFAVAAVFVLSVSILNLPKNFFTFPNISLLPAEIPDPPEPKVLTVSIDVQSEEMSYTGSEIEIIPDFSFTASEEDRDVTDEISVELNEDAAIKAMDVGNYPFGLSEEDFMIDAEGYDEFNVKINDGSLTILPADITVTISGNAVSTTYDKQAHSASGYRVSSDRSDYQASYVSFSGKAAASRTDVGTSYMGLTSGQFTNNNDNYNVTFRVTDGYVRINRASVTVTITGSNSSVTYDGDAHSVSGYTTSISNSNYTSSQFSFSGSATASRTEVGTTYMGLSSSHFKNLDNNYSVSFNVTDGYIEITEPESNKPVINLIDVEDNYNLDMVMFAMVTASVMPNDASQVGGSIDATVYYKNGSGVFVEDTEFPYHYDGDGNNTELELDVVHRMPEDLEMCRQVGKLVVKYTYPDGTTGTYESEEFYMYKGSFVETDWNFGEYGILINGNQLEVDLIFIEDINFENGGHITVSPDNVNIDFASAYVSVFDDNDDYVESLSHEKEQPDEIQWYDGSDGYLHMHLIYNFDTNLDPGSPYTVYTGFYGQMTDSASGWNSIIW